MEVKTNKIVMFYIGILLISSMAYGKSLDIEKKAGEVTVKASIDRDPPIVGKNNLSVELLDNRGSAIKDAEIQIFYLMPSMPAMNYEITPGLKGNRYIGTIELVMAGQWKVDVKWKRPGCKIKKISFTFEVK